MTPEQRAALDAVMNKIGHHNAYLEDVFLAGARVAESSLADELAKALRNFSFLAQTTGGIAGRDPDLLNAIDKATALLARYDAERKQP